MSVKNNFAFLSILLFCTQFLMAQVSVEKLIRGQILSHFIPIEGVNITNTSSKIISVSDQHGNFSILAKEGQILSFSATNYEPFRKFINKHEFGSGNIAINIIPLSIELKEVIINNHSEITAENMGIIPRGQVRLSPAERKLYTATSGTDKVLNYFSGRTKMLKKELGVEKKEGLMHKLEFLFEDKYYIESLKIPEEQIKGFQYYCVENIDFVNALNARNKTMCMFLITGLASNYNKKRMSDEIKK